jgi:hypothetical protein
MAWTGSGQEFSDFRQYDNLLQEGQSSIEGQLGREKPFASGSSLTFIGKRRKTSAFRP